MPAARHFTRIDTLELKLQIERKLGHLKAQKYFDLLTKFLSLKIGKSDFDRLCIGTIGRENVRLHNYLLRSIIKNAHLSKTPPPKESKVEGAVCVKVPNGYQKSSLQSICRDFIQSPRKGRSILSERKFKDRPSPLGPHGKSHNIAFEYSVPKNQEQQSATELLSFGSRPPGSVEDGEEVDQAAGSPSIHSRSPVRAPLGIPLNTKGSRKVLFNRFSSSYHMGACQNSGELPDSNSLRKRLEHKLEMEGIKVSVDCANLLNNSLDVYLKRLIKPCMDLAASRSGQKHAGQGQIQPICGMNGVWPVRHFQKSSGSSPVSMLDFRLTMELNPWILGEEWPMQLEKVCFRASEE
ncbi:uncharacterized protein LOC110630553 [Manihot esculenta]|nr:uncharacterized protein LOC110630553 [Manihot esculenta]XP_021633781.1 uncharacterized protein LOC110630553 [Manihot esculenta]KAG8641145.1 hypothetical protein MANES_13G113200v8 [Manihot esculenta]KAG8641146.1 hypothetical protein MANES_13G113200v8 [Manihot esculenta]KAG8641147.1 hypothetical protein MANES_13G113200v8 [Manihot esculenta]KAG8641148.1 hypothetical protein MANES_13G113200v8 [Manihot esculenta]KAG8641149.1 hypothetical protein MANES_13G113200v8 [Manihot esculenta]